MAKVLLIGGSASGQIVHTDMKTRPCGHGKQPLDGLWFYLNLLEGLLLRR